MTTKKPMSIHVLDSLIVKHKNFKVLDCESKADKLRDISDNIFCSAARTSTDLRHVFELIKNKTAFNATRFYTDMNNGSLNNIFNYVDSSLVKFAKLLFTKKGISTPNAASGKGELMLLFLSTEFRSPTKGDVMLKNRLIEMKVNGGKIGFGVGKEINKSFVKKCKSQGIKLPVNKAGKEEFVPFNEKHKLALGNNYVKALQLWCSTITGKKSTSTNVKKALSEVLPVVVEKSKVFVENDVILAITENGKSTVYSSAADLVSDKSLICKTRWEYRCHQANKLSVYLGK